MCIAGMEFNQIKPDPIRSGEWLVLKGRRDDWCRCVMRAWHSTGRNNLSRAKYMFFLIVEEDVGTEGLQNWPFRVNTHEVSLIGGGSPST